MPNTETKLKTIDLHPAHGVFPLTGLLESGLWAGMSANAKATFGVLWDYHRKYPDACRPSRGRLAAEAGISQPSVTKALKELQAIGLVTVLHDPGPRTNTYKLNWLALRVPEQKPSKNSKSPFKLPSNPKLPHEVSYDEEGNGTLVWSKGTTKGYKLPDGCWVRSAKEMHIHGFLCQWLVPHWCDVSYFDLGIVLRQKNGESDTKSTVDFVVGPKLLIEQAGQRFTQKEATRYWKKLNAKVKAAEDAGWTMLVITPDKTPGEWLYDAIATSWAQATIEDAENLKRRLEKAGWLNSSKKKNLRLLAHINNAKARLSGEKEPRTQTGLYEQAVGDNGMPVTVKMNPPKLCLMESACPPVKEPSVEDLIDDILEDDAGW